MVDRDPPWANLGWGGERGQGCSAGQTGSWASPDPATLRGAALPLLLARKGKETEYDLLRSNQA